MYIIDRLRDFVMTPSSFFISKKMIKMSKDLDSQYIEELALKTEGFSAREIEKFVVAAHDWAFSQENPILERSLVDKVFSDFQQQHISREDWENKKRK